jgi:hypothetical protein
MNKVCLHWLATLALLLFSWNCFAADPSPAQRKLLYVAEPGIRDYTEYGGHGVIVFDILDGHKFVRRIPTAGVDEKGKPLNVKGICACIPTKRLYVSTTRTLMCLDLVTDKLLWEKSYEGGCDRMALSPDGREMYLPSLEGAHWNLIDALTGDVIKKIVLKSGAHNTIYGLDGRYAYLAGLKSPTLTIMDAKTREISGTVGPFGNVIRPFTVNGRQTLCFVNVNDLLGFEVGDLKTGKKLYRIEVPGKKTGAEKRHGCPSHGIGLTPDEKELWLTDAANNRLHIFDATVMPPKEIKSMELRDQPGWITFSIDGQYAYPSTGDVVDVKTRKIVTDLKDEEGHEVQSEKLLEIDFEQNEPVKAGDQFGLGREL